MSLPGYLDYRGRQVALKYHKLHTGRKQHPPNSLAALQEVLEGRAAVIEFDISLTRDGEFVLLHDATLERETTGVGSLRSVSQAEFKSLHLRGSEEPTAALSEVVGMLRGVGYSPKVQVDLKEKLPLSSIAAQRLLKALWPLREKEGLRVVVGCLGDWNLRALRRLDSGLEVGLDFAYHLDSPVDSWVRLPLHTNAYGYLDDHPLGYRLLLSPAEYLLDRVETLLQLVPRVSEFYLRREFVLQTLGDGFNPIAFIHDQLGAWVDVWTLDQEDPGALQALEQVLEAGADQITTNTSLQWHQFFSERSRGGK